MPIAISGSGTISGVSVGGLPDGIVDTDMIAANAVATDMLAAAAATAPKRGAGSILQVVQGTTSTQTDVTSGTWTDTTLTASITPRSNSKVLVLIDQHVSMGVSATTVSAGIRLLRGSTVISTDWESGTGPRAMWIEANVSYNYIAWRNGRSYLDGSPGGNGSTSITYKTQGRHYNNGTISYQWQTNPSTITLLEVAA